MNIKQNDMEYLIDQVNTGKITAEQANIEKVRMQRVLLNIGKMPKEVRTALNKAVKVGYLNHKKRDGLFPEVYYHPEFEYMANKERNAYVKAVAETLKGVLI